MTNTTFTILFFIAGILTVIGTSVIGLFTRNNEERDCFCYGIAFLFGVAMVMVSSFILFVPKNTYLDKYEGKIENIKEYQVDTTFVTTNGITDTTYTFYYNSKDEENI